MVKTGMPYTTARRVAIVAQQIKANNAAWTGNGKGGFWRLEGGGAVPPTALGCRV
jgi:hypothetical protein